MSLITQCPACTTLFKVVPDQLRVSDGWVRCGQCDEVFDANAHLQTTLQEARQSSFGELPKRSRVVPPPPSPIPTSVSSPASVAPASHATVPSEAGVLSALEAESDVPLASDDFDVEAAVLAEYEALKKADDLAALFVESPEQEQEQEQPLLSFMQPVADAAVVRNRPWVRPTLQGLCVGLSMALVLHAVVRERDWIAAKLPVTKSFLSAGCDLLGCQVSALRDIESVVIDSSSFVKVRTEVYRVHFTLKNTALNEVATPALELTLTDAHDQPVVRRIFFPHELGAHSMTIGAGAELIAVLPMSVKLPGDAQRISGYRLLVFYP